MTQPRFNYPTRTAYFAREAGLQTAEQQEQLWEDLCEERLQYYRIRCGDFTIEELADFKARFGL